MTVNGEFVASRTVIWAAGNAAAPKGKSCGASVDRTGRVIVNEDLSIPGHPDIFAIGVVGLRKRLLVLFQWTWSYLTFGRGARLIYRNFRPSLEAWGVEMTNDR